MSGLEILGAAGVSLQLIKAASVCLSVVHDIRQMGQISRDQNDAHLSLHIQGIRFEMWCSALKIQEIILSTESGQCDKIIHLKDAIESQLRLNNPRLLDVILKALHDMNLKLAEVSGIISRYSTVPATQSTSTLEIPKSKLSPKWTRRFMRKSAQFSSPDTDSVSISSDQIGTSAESGSTVTSRLKWVTSDRNKVNELLDSITKTNELLFTLLDPVFQKQVDRKTDLAVLGNISETTLIATECLTDSSDLKELAKIKRWQRRELNENQGDEAHSMHSFNVNSGDSLSTRVHSYQIQDFNRAALPHGEHRSLATLEDNKVIVEWKYYSNRQSIPPEQTLRLGGLVGLLNKNGPFKKFCTLPCKGLVNDMLNSRIGVIFSTEGPVTQGLETLHSFLKTSNPIPVGQRFSLAKNLATAVHRLHSVDWLHKSIRSHSIIYFPNGQGDKVAASSPISFTTPMGLPKFFLVGWDLSRPDHPSELSETLSISTVGYQNSLEATLMYSHPDIQAGIGTGKRPRYRPQYDIYSLGLVLLEIGLWRTLGDLRRLCRHDSDFRLQLRTEFCDKLLYRMGEVYWKVVQRCLNNDFGSQPNTEADDGYFSLQVAFERHVVCELERCFA